MLQGVPKNVCPTCELAIAYNAGEHAFFLGEVHLFVEAGELPVLPHPVSGDVAIACGALDLVVPS